MRHAPRRTTGVGLALALLLSLLTPLLVASPASAAGTGSLTGRVLVQPTGGTATAPPNGVWVQVEYSASSSEHSDTDLDQFQVAADGTFRFTGLDNGWYWLRFGTAGYASEYYDSSNGYHDATPVEVRGGAVALPKNVVLEKSGAVAGQVTDAQGRPVAGASVKVATSSSAAGETVETDANGQYDTAAAGITLTPGTYHAEANRWGDLDDAVYLADSAQITLAAGEVHTHNFKLTERPRVLVTVLGPDGTPLESAPLDIQVKHPDFDNGDWGPIRYGPNETDARGRYRFIDNFDAARFHVGLPAGYDGPAAVGEWWQDAYTAKDARVLTFPRGVEMLRKVTVRLGVGRLSATKPVVAGKARVGKALSARTPAWGPAPVKLRYTWLRGGKPVKGATSARYKLTRKDVGRRISVRVTGTKSGFATLARASAKTAKVKR
ncbi:carboxypeptidase-like regulatory domain-containing protein [Nocardioides dongkuii]|uniref:carboxypeptidase-like regulatory domain-containing protein n=1 Tax=Nocardioides dongkuii TaxID=2760089 RepID=UPI0018775459|nr:carboxypeptidase-like regulatory domain-containing protein [Nocardioides dongkuii]